MTESGAFVFLVELNSANDLLTDVETVDCVTDTTVLEGDNVTLRCSAETDTDSTAVISWEKDGEALSTSKPGLMISGTSSPSHLRILDANTNNAGLYKCIAKNNNTGVTKACAEARVIVQCK